MLLLHFANSTAVMLASYLCSWLLCVHIRQYLNLLNLIVFNKKKKWVMCVNKECSTRIFENIFS